MTIAKNTLLLTLFCMLSISLVISTGCRKKPTNPNASSKNSGLTGHAKLVADLIAGEDLVLDLTPRLNKLAICSRNPRKEKTRNSTRT